ncbi:MAG: selenocysteine-specific translation elongation factor [Firmicutes bacterium]|nr:selenocysteine-specific translation elongation factor [Bacillota bacterium]
MKHIIIGTAGHVDHGKTTLVRAMTGVDTDRLKEEKERGISIELGFAPLTLPSGQRAGLVDVPGHERFIKHMLAGVAGIDLVLLVIAADEGVMPQTREHLDIVQLLNVKKGIVVITKKDLVEEDWLYLVEEEVREALKDTFLAEAPMIAVSAVTGEGLSELLHIIDRLVADVTEKAVDGKTRLPIDRVFSIAGFGTVVTGTLFSGQLKVGDPVEILPEGISTRVRTLQVHGHKVDRAVAGQRVAVNLASVETSELARGSVLLEPNYLSSSFRVDAHLELLRHLAAPLKNLARIRFHQGTKEALGRVVLLDRDELAPGESSYVQLVMEEPVVVARYDRFVIRSYSPMVTIGGGTVIDPNPPKRKRFREDVLRALATQEQGTPIELVNQHLLTTRPPIISVSLLTEKLGLQTEIIKNALRELVESGQAVLINVDGSEHAIHQQVLDNWWSEVQSLLANYHHEYPLRTGLPREELRSKKFGAVPAKTFNALLQFWEERGLVRATGRNVSLAGHQPAPQGKMAQALEHVLVRYRVGGFQPPDWSEMVQDCALSNSESEELLNYCLEQGLLVKVSEDTFFASTAIEEAKRKLTQFLKDHGAIQIGEVRDLLETSRRYVLPLMEYFDREKFTRRVGDKRVLLK